MTIELDLQSVSSRTQTILEKSVVESSIKRELERICNKHREAANSEMQNFMAEVLTHWDMDGMCKKIVITLPEPK